MALALQLPVTVTCPPFPPSPFATPQTLHSETRPPSPAHSPSQTEEVPERHMRYYFEESMAIFKVENKLFKVHRHYLIRDSVFFQTLFQCPQPSEEETEGSTDERAIPLPGVPSKEFEILLDYFYEGVNFEQFLRDSSFKETVSPLLYASPKKKKGPEKSKPKTDSHWCLRVQVDHLLDLLSISSRYEFDKARQYSIREIEKRWAQPSCDCPNPTMDPVEKIARAQKFDIDGWLFPAYEELCKRERALEVSEAEKIGLTTSVLIAQARERARRSPGGEPSKSVVSEAVRFAFEKEKPHPTFSGWGFGFPTQ